MPKDDREIKWGQMLVILNRKKGNIMYSNIMYVCMCVCIYVSMYLCMSVSMYVKHGLGDKTWSDKTWRNKIWSDKTWRFITLCFITPVHVLLLQSIPYFIIWRCFLERPFEFERCWVICGKEIFWKQTCNGKKNSCIIALFTCNSLTAYKQNRIIAICQKIR